MMINKFKLLYHYIIYTPVCVCVCVCVHIYITAMLVRHAGVLYIWLTDLQQINA